MGGAIYYDCRRVTGTTGVYHRYYRSLGFRPFEPTYRHAEVRRRIDLSVLPVFHRCYRWSSVLPVKDRYYRQFISTPTSGLKYSGVKMTYRYYRCLTGTTGGIPVLPTVLVSRPPWRWAKPTGTTGAPRQKRIFLSVRECKGVSQAHYIDRHEHSSSHLASLICIPLDSAAFPLTQAKIKIYRNTWAETLSIQGI
jgi:hypothetical protein